METLAGDHHRSRRHGGRARHAHGLRPTLALLEPAAAAGHKPIAFIGFPCQVYALRALEAQLGFARIYVIGTPCSDTTTTGNFHSFLTLLDANLIPSAIWNFALISKWTCGLMMAAPPN